ncbi:MAG TPA: secondary thiamine-phosphate synthase enzyme YjbQ [Isosphaeraceae bacterium]|jgi:secondary thiamine-phosphate synthase enzyme|nr:secondary thiamine-phosphate synthase enzyme YjbQ [Isosphaeraceae bacterium]
MKSHTEYLTLYIPTQIDFVNITAKVEEAVFTSGIQEGLCLVNSMHLSSSVFIHAREPELEEDQQQWLGWMNWLGPAHAPQAPVHPDDDMDPQRRRQQLGREVVVAVTRGRLDFGDWEQVYYGEFDGMRDKRVLIKIIGE